MYTVLSVRIVCKILPEKNLEGLHTTLHTRSRHVAYSGYNVLCGHMLNTPHMFYARTVKLHACYVLLYTPPITNTQVIARGTNNPSQLRTPINICIDTHIYMYNFVFSVSVNERFNRTCNVGKV